MTKAENTDVTVTSKVLIVFTVQPCNCKIACNACIDYNAIELEDIMASMTIRDLDERLKTRLRVRAARNNRSMEEEVRAILKTALNTDQGTSKSLAGDIRARIEPLGGVELSIPARGPIRDVDVE